MIHRIRHSALIVLCLLVVGIDPVWAQDVPEFVPAFAPDKAHIAYSDAKWVVWFVPTMISPIKNPPRAPTFTTKYYRQTLSERAAPQVFQMTGTYWMDVCAVLDDGTVLLKSWSNLAWAFPDGTTRPRDLRWGGGETIPLDESPESRVVGGFHDGLLLQPYGPKRPQTPIYFVPISQRQLQLDRKFRVTDEVSDHHLQSHFRRSGHWLATGPGLVNLETHERYPFPGVHSLTRAAAMHGDKLVISSHPPTLVTISDRRQSTVDFGPPKGVTGTFFALRNDIGYYFNSAFELRAISLDGKSTKSDALLTLPRPAIGTGPMSLDIDRIPRLITDHGLVIGIGSKWEQVPWLKELPVKAAD